MSFQKLAQEIPFKLHDAVNDVYRLARDYQEAEYEQQQYEETLGELGNPKRYAIPNRNRAYRVVEKLRVALKEAIENQQDINDAAKDILVHMEGFLLKGRRHLFKMMKKILDELGRIQLSESLVEERDRILASLKNKTATPEELLEQVKRYAQEDRALEEKERALFAQFVSGQLFGADTQAVA